MFLRVLIKKKLVLKSPYALVKQNKKVIILVLKDHRVTCLESDYHVTCFMFFKA